MLAGRVGRVASIRTKIGSRAAASKTDITNTIWLADSSASKAVTNDKNGVSLWQFVGPFGRQRLFGVKNFDNVQAKLLGPAGARLQARNLVPLRPLWSTCCCADKIHQDRVTHMITSIIVGKGESEDLSRCWGLFESFNR